VTGAKLCSPRKAASLRHPFSIINLALGITFGMFGNTSEA
jgi:hypothetical protein